MSYVVFTENNARIIPKGDLDQFPGCEYTDNLDFSRVRGMPPHHWKLSESLIVPLSAAEIKEREKHIKTYGVMNVAPVAKRSWLSRHYKDCLIIITALAFCGALLWRHF